MDPVITRILYVCEFFLVLLATHVVWPQAGGQGHLDLMAWYWKLFLPLAFAAAIVAMTAAIQQPEAAAATADPTGAANQVDRRFWNRRTLVWFVIVCLLAVAMGLVTYYYHLHENDGLEEAPLDETAAVLWREPRRSLEAS